MGDKRRRSSSVPKDFTFPRKKSKNIREEEDPSTTSNDRIPSFGFHHYRVYYANKATEITTKKEAHSSTSYDPPSASNVAVSIITEEELKEYRRYEMNHKKRGIALIFNHENFDENDLLKRQGASEDGKRLSNTMHSLGFEVLLYQDKTWSEMKDILYQVKKQDHTNHDCLLVAIMTHGEENGCLHAKDDKYSAEEVWDCFKTVKSLAGKPKIFLFQACRGSKMEESTAVQCSSSSSRRSVIPSNADYLMVYSCMEGYTSWRNTTEGSWFIQDLCKDIDEYAPTEDMLSILTHTLRRVAYTRCSVVPTNPDKHGRQAMPIFSSTLTKLLYFCNTSP